MNAVRAEKAAGFARASTADRIVAAVTGAIALAVLIIAACLNPSPEGHGTHTQLGLPACGMYLATGYPCPTCGMTTAFAAMTHCRPLDAFRIQPLGALLALLTGVWFWGALHVAVFGSRLGAVVSRMLTARMMWAVALAGLAAWGYKLLTMH